MRSGTKRYLSPVTMEKNRIRARAAMDRKRAADPVAARKLEIYQRLIELQGGEHCAICKVPRNPTQRRLAIDHDWDTDEIRGLLCSRCNGILGRNRAVEAWLHAAVAYLDRTTYTGINYSEVRAADKAYPAFFKQNQPSTKEGAA